MSFGDREEEEASLGQFGSPAGKLEGFLGPTYLAGSSHCLLFSAAITCKPQV